MRYPIDITKAAQILVAECGTQIAASRRGGQLHFMSILRQRFSLADAEATRIISVLEQRQVLRWISAYRSLQACPGTLELCGTWQLQPQHLEEQAT
jgi:hypothetical protein